MKHYFLGMAANYSGGKWLRHLFAVGRKRDYDELAEFLGKKYDGEAVLCKNGRSALALALKTYFRPGDEVLVNGFTCYAVYEAVKAAKLKPVFVDINKQDLNFDIKTLRNARSGRFEVIRDNGSEIASEPRNDGRERRGPRSDWTSVQGIIIQNTLGNPVDIKAIERFAKENDLLIIEDLAHSAGIRYPDGREAGTVGVATVLSFGKDKSVDTISGGAVVFRGELLSNFGARPAGPLPRAAGATPRAAALRTPSVLTKASPSKLPRLRDHLRARFYPMFGALCRTLSYVHLGGVLMRLLVKIHLVEKSADNKLDLERRMSKFEAKLALEQIKKLKNKPLRKFYLVDDREKVLKELRKAGYFFDGFWYEKPVSPERYYKKVHFPEEECPNAVFVSKRIINFPNIYSREELATARKIIEKYLIKEGADGKK